MRVLVLGETLRPRQRRMRQAALGLALRGHLVYWSEPDHSTGAMLSEGPAAASGTLQRIGGGAARFRVRADVAIGAGERVERAAVSGWLAGAHAMVLALEFGTAAGWNAARRWCWESLDGRGLVDSPGGAEGAEATPIEPGRLARWSGEPVPEIPSAIHPDTEILERLAEGVCARRRGGAPRPAAFLDRDGTLVVERGYLSEADDLELLAGVPEALRRLQAAGYALVVISNQSGVGRGMFPLERVHQAMGRLRVLLRRHGVELDAIYFCPHRPEEGCDCRKPGTGLLRRAAADLRLALHESVMIGDKRIDAAAGQAAGGRGILVRTGYGREQEMAAGGTAAPPAPAAVCDDLADAVRWLLEHHA